MNARTGNRNLRQVKRLPNHRSVHPVCENLPEFSAVHIERSENCFVRIRPRTHIVIVPCGNRYLRPARCYADKDEKQSKNSERTSAHNSTSHSGLHKIQLKPTAAENVQRTRAA